METITGFPYWRVDINKEGQRFAPVDLQLLLPELATTQATDLIVIAHGWNNDMADAQDLYARYFKNVADLIANHTVELPGKKLAVLGIFWPSKKFAEESLIPSGAAGLEDGREETLRQSIDTLRDLLHDPMANARLGRAKDLVGELSINSDAPAEFAQCVTDVLPAGSAEVNEDGAAVLLNLSGSELMSRLRALPAGPMPGVEGGAAVLVDAEGGAAALGSIVEGATGLGDPLNSAFDAAQQLLNYTTYYVIRNAPVL